jgi:hypothetical protein
VIESMIVVVASIRRLCNLGKKFLKGGSRSAVFNRKLPKMCKHGAIEL